MKIRSVIYIWILTLTLSVSTALAQTEGVTITNAFDTEDSNQIFNPFLPQLPKKPKVVEKKPEIIITPKQKPVPAGGNSDKTPGTPTQAVTKPKPVPIPQPNFNITGIFWNTNRPQAIINGQVVDVGDKVDLFTIESIDPNGIEVSIRGVRMTVKP